MKKLDEGLVAVRHMKDLWGQLSSRTFNANKKLKTAEQLLAPRHPILLTGSSDFVIITIATFLDQVINQLCKPKRHQICNFLELLEHFLLIVNLSLKPADFPTLLLFLVRHGHGYELHQFIILLNDVEG